MPITTPHIDDNGMHLGIIPDEPMSTYHASGAYGSSKVKDYISYPQGFNKRHIEKHPMYVQGDSKAFLEGSLVHALVEGTALDDYCQLAQGTQYDMEQVKAYLNDSSKVDIAIDKFVTASGNMSTGKASKAWQDEATAAGYIPLTPKQYETLKYAAKVMGKPDGSLKTVVTDITFSKCNFLYERILENGKAKEMIENSQHEVTARLKDPKTGLYIQARYDLYQPGKMICDIKTSAAPMHKFHYAARDLGYDVQAALYLMTFYSFHPDATGTEFYFIVVSKTYPFEVQCLLAPPTMISEGFNKVESALAGIARKDFDSRLSETGLIDW
tara:strand:+ start:1721 stop:2701 length:981 start_codon:yes stop_codon:yes gene_type:complete